MSKSIHSQGHDALVAALAQARKDASLSQAEVAKRLRCHQSLIARIESGQRRVDVRELVILARALEVDAAELVSKVALGVGADERI